MARVNARGQRADAPRPPRSRGRALDLALTAAGEPSLVSTFDLARGSLSDRLFCSGVLTSGHPELTYASWPVEADGLTSEPLEPVFRDGCEAVYRMADGTLAKIEVCGGWARLRVAAGTVESLSGAVDAFQAAYPATYLSATDNRVPVTFWTNTVHGPVRRLRMIDSAPWEQVEGNYPSETRDEVAALMDDAFAPGKSGQLILWQGPPGTGKTWALRALASQWLPWAEFHYITDPDSFFVDDPAYMVDVLLSETYAAFDEAGDVYHENASEGKWRVLILEDTGELLSATAKEKYGQGLSRLLNVVDGMIGQGLRVLCLVTTNDELGELNAAVRRPGRCASQIVFPAFPPAEASAWLGEDVPDEMTVAEMYARRGDAADALALEEEAAAEALASDDEPADPRDEIARVAEEVNPLAVDYGQTAYDAESRTVLWVSGDGTSDDEVEQAREAFLAIEGVDDFAYEAEGAPDGWCDAEVVYGGDPFGCDDAAVAAAVELALAPLPLEV